MDLDKRRALSAFYREEFLKHFEHLELNGVIDDSNREVLDKARRRFMSELDSVCWRSDFAAMAETLLQNFDALTRLSELDPQKGH